MIESTIDWFIVRKNTAKWLWISSDYFLAPDIHLLYLLPKLSKVDYLTTRTIKLDILPLELSKPVK